MRKLTIIKAPPVGPRHEAVLAVGTIHEEITTPKGYENSTIRGIWVMGANAEPVKLIGGEYQFLPVEK